MPTLEITTCARCTVRCTYCPQDKLEAAYKDPTHRLDVDTFKYQVLDRLPTNVRVDFSGFVEPWLHPECTQLLLATLNRGFNVGIYTTLQGMNEPDEVVRHIEQHASQVEVVCLHLPDAEGNMRGLKTNRSWWRALHAFQALRERGTIKRFESMAMGDEAVRLLPDAELTRFVGVDRAGSLTRGDVAGQPIEEPVHHVGPTSCSFTPFYDQNVMLPNGDVVLCCEDYGLRHPIGNMFRQTWHELDRGHMLDANLKPGGDTICKRCTRATTYGQVESKQMWVSP